MTYNTVDGYECPECETVYSKTHQAESCYNRCRLQLIVNDIARLRVRGDVCSGKHSVEKLEAIEIISELEEQRDELREKYGDNCDHNDAMKTYLESGGVYCHTCNEQVNEYPK